MKPTKTQLQNRRNVISALRSGVYTQSTECLHDTVKGYCCLGVACTVAKVPSKLEPSSVFSEKDSTIMQFDLSMFNDDCTDEVGTVPDEFVAKTYGISLDQADHFTVQSIKMNDNERLSFKKIATRWKKYFVKCDAYNIKHAT